MADQTTFEAAAFTAQGTARDKVALPETLFDGTVNMPVMHQAVKAFLANQRQANAHTKTRGYVAGGNQKPWKQKGTGRARQGSIRAPNFVGGGTVFGPSNERNYKQAVPKQIRALARKSALNAWAREEAIVVIDRFDYDGPSTKRMQALVDRLGLTGRKVLVLTSGIKPAVFLSARNLPTTHVMPYSDVSTYHILWSDFVLIEAEALGHSLDPVEETETAAPVRAKPAKKAAKKSTATSDEAEGDAHVPTGGAQKKTAAKSARGAKSAGGAKSARGAKSGGRAAAKSARGGKSGGKAASKKSTEKRATGKSAAKRATRKKKGD
jgi:large subunit ribosomal protein L4